MTLVDYVTSDEDEDEDGNENENENERRPDHEKISDDYSTVKPRELKRKRESPATNSELPPLPSKFHDLYASKVRVTTRDDPSFHGGRKRITPHVEGNWPSHIYIEWYPSNVEHDALTSLINPVKNAAAEAGDSRVVSLLTSELGSPLPLHISLSRPIVFTASQKDSFVESLRQNIKDSGLRPFEIRLADPHWVSNFERTTWFLALQIRRPEGDELNRLLAVCNGTVDEYSQSRLYASPQPVPEQHIRSSPFTFLKTPDFSSAYHFSIGWALEQPTSCVMEATKLISSGLVLESIRRISIKAEIVKVKTGNIITSIHLAPKNVEGEGLFAT